MSTFSGIRVLVIDDDAMVLDTLARQFEWAGAETHRACGGAEGLEAFRRVEPDIVFTDLVMPDVCGLDVIAVITEESPDTPIIVISGMGGVSDAMEAIRLGAWDYITKPITDSHILRHVADKAMERAYLLQESRRYQARLEDEVARRTAELVSTNQELAETRLQIIRRLAMAAEYRDEQTGQHVIRVGHYSRILAEGLGLDDETVDLIHQAGLLHDIGKIGIPDSVLLKIGELDRHEWEAMQRHSLIGADMLKPLSAEGLAWYRQHTAMGEEILGESETPLLKTASKVAACHHEWWNGEGYPSRLAGEEIPLAARIVAVSDTYDALTTRRPYKDVISDDDVRDMMRRGSGSHFDPAIIDVFFDQWDLIQETRRECEKIQRTNRSLTERNAVLAETKRILQVAYTKTDGRTRHVEVGELADYLVAERL